MAWTTPKTDWTEADRCTATDMNRINANVEYLMAHADPTEHYTAYDIVSIENWRSMKNKVIALAAMVGMILEPPDDRATFDNFNRMESIIEQLKQPVDLRYKQRLANRYSGQITLGRGNYTGGRK